MASSLQTRPVAAGIAVYLAVLVVGFLASSSLNPLASQHPSLLLWLPPLLGPMLGGATAAGFAARSPLLHGAAVGAIGSAVLFGALLVVWAGFPIAYLAGVVALATLLSWFGAMLRVTIMSSHGA